MFIYGTLRHYISELRRPIAVKPSYIIGSVCTETMPFSACPFKRFLFSKILGVRPRRQKLSQNFHACLAARYVEKFCEVTLPGPEVITANTLNFKPTFESSLLKIVGDPRSR